MKQVLALGVAALLIAAALAAREALDGDAGTDGDGDELVVACVPELRTACTALEGVADLRVEEPAATVAAAADGEVDAWVTFDPWPAVAAEQQRRPLLDGPNVTVATSGLLLLTRTEALPAACGEAADWSCVAEATGSNAAALPDVGTAFGLVALGHAAAGWAAIELPGVTFSRAEIESPPFQNWLDAIAFGGDPLRDMLQIGRAGPVATTTTQARYAGEVVASREADALDPVPGTEPASVAVVVAGRSASRLAEQERFLDALAALGYDRADDPDARTIGIPEPGVLLALQELA